MPKKLRETQDIKSPASKFGQMIGDAFAEVVDATIRAHIENTHPEYELLKAEEGKTLIKLEKVSGAKLQMDTAIVAKSSFEPVAVPESKWLKDARHHKRQRRMDSSTPGSKEATCDDTWFGGCASWVLDGRRWGSSDVGCRHQNGSRGDR